MTRVHFAVQAHPIRAEMALALAASIGGDVEIVYDPEPDAAIRSAWRCYRHALERTPADATHICISQDDVEVCPGFRVAVERAVEARPDRVLLFFVGGNPRHYAQAVYEACDRDEPWAECSPGQWIPVVCTCWPVSLIPGLLAYVDAQHWPEGFSSDDERVGRYIREIKHWPLASVPSLAEHRDIVPSLVGRRNRNGLDPGRIAACFIGTDCGDCAAGIDWNVGPGGSVS